MNDIPEIFSYFHCATCLSGNLTVGWTMKGLQAYCENCNKSVINLDFGGMKVKVISTKEASN